MMPEGTLLLERGRTMEALNRVQIMLSLTEPVIRPGQLLSRHVILIRDFSNSHLARTTAHMLTPRSRFVPQFHPPHPVYLIRGLRRHNMKVASRSSNPAPRS